MVVVDNAWWFTEVQVSEVGALESRTSVFVDPQLNWSALLLFYSFLLLGF